MHRTLQRQLRRLGLDATMPPSPDEWADLIAIVDRSYKERDDSRYTLERSMEVSSAEMRDLYAKIRDASEQIAAERDHLEAVVGAVQDGITLCDRAGSLRVFNRRMVEFTGYSFSEVKEWDDFFGEMFVDVDDGVAGRGVFEWLWSLDGQPPANVTLQSRHQAPRPASVSTTVIRHDGEELLLVVYHDMSERFESRRRLRSLKEFYERILTEVPLEIAVLNAFGEYEFVNPGSLPDASVREWLIGKTDIDYCELRSLSAGLAQERLVYLNYVVKEKQPVQWEDSGLDSLPADAPPESDSKEPARAYLRTLVPVMNDAGEVIRLVRYSHDVTDLRRIEHALKRAKDEAEDANRAKSSFLANMSHELRTPLNAIIGFTELIRSRRKGVDDEESLFLGRVSENGKHLLTLINDVLDLSKVEAGEIQLDMVPVDVKALVEFIADISVLPLAKKGVDLRISAPVDATWIDADPFRLKQVLINLVGNATKFTHDGHVAIALDVSDDGTPTRLRVSDTGIGIPEHRLDAIFDIFQQAESDTTPQYGGTGLGLSISRQLCRAMGFEVTASSRLGHGSEFTVDFQSSTPRRLRSRKDRPATDRTDEAAAASADPRLSNA